MKFTQRFLATLPAVLLLAACGDGSATGDASLALSLEPETTITDGIEPGDGLENIRDGWAVSFDKYILVLGAVELRLTSDPEEHADAPELYAIDLTDIDDSGEPLWSFDGLADGRWDLGYQISGHGAVRHDSVSEEDFAHLEEDEHAYLIEGRLTKEGGQSCPPAALAEIPDDATSSGENAAGDACYPAAEIAFHIEGHVDVEFGPCEVDGLSGVALTSGRTAAAALTIHGDHLFFNGFPEGSEGGVMRLAQWLADADLNLDGLVETSELERIAPSALSEIDDRYQLGGAPLQPLDNMHTYVNAQIMTQGHFQGEGECAINGEAHDHGHDH